MPQKPFFDWEVDAPLVEDVFLDAVELHVLQPQFVGVQMALGMIMFIDSSFTKFILFLQLLNHIYHLLVLIIFIPSGNIIFFVIVFHNDILSSFSTGEA